jgi:hypothetical protein
MAKKITARKNRVIRGQPHKLAYINDAEEGLLMSLGGTGEIVDGIPAFVPGFGSEKSDGAARDKEAAADRDRPGPSGPSGDGPNYGISGGQAQAMFGDATMAGMVTADDVDKILDNSKQADKTGTLPELLARAKRGQQAQDLMFGKNMLTTLANKAASALGLNTIDTTKTAYNDLANLIGMKGSYVNSKGQLFAPTGGSTMFGPSGLTQGYFGQVNYTGNPNPDYDGLYADLVNPRDPDLGGEGATMDKVKPANPLTGTCEPGYTFDDDLQACRLDTGGGGDTTIDGNFGESGETYYRPNALDTAGQFQTVYAPDYDYDAASKAFTAQKAYNPDFYERDPMRVDGFRPMSQFGLLS